MVCRWRVDRLVGLAIWGNDLALFDDDLSLFREKLFDFIAGPGVFSTGLLVCLDGLSFCGVSVLLEKKLSDSTASKPVH